MIGDEDKSLTQKDNFEKYILFFQLLKFHSFYFLTIDTLY